MVVARGEGRSLGVSEAVSTIYGGLLLVMGGGRERGKGEGEGLGRGVLPRPSNPEPV